MLGPRQVNEKQLDRLYKFMGENPEYLLLAAFYLTPELELELVGSDSVKELIACISGNITLKEAMYGRP